MDARRERRREGMSLLGILALVLLIGPVVVVLLSFAYFAGDETALVVLLGVLATRRLLRRAASTRTPPIAPTSPRPRASRRSGAWPRNRARAGICVACRDTLTGSGNGRIL
jgi:hypothetical protein